MSPQCKSSHISSFVLRPIFHPMCTLIIAVRSKTVMSGLVVDNKYSKPCYIRFAINKKWPRFARFEAKLCNEKWIFHTTIKPISESKLIRRWNCESVGKGKEEKTRKSTSSGRDKNKWSRGADPKQKRLTNWRDWVIEQKPRSIYDFSLQFVPALTKRSGGKLSISISHINTAKRRSEKISFPSSFKKREKWKSNGGSKKD